MYSLNKIDASDFFLSDLKKISISDSSATFNFFFKTPQLLESSKIPA